MKLDEVTNQDVQRLKLALRGKAAKTTNNVLTVLGTMLKVAVAWEVLAEMPCTVALLKAPKASMKFHDFDEFETLVAAAGEIDPRAELIVLLGGEAGLRCGEMMALERSDLDLVQRQICVERSDWKGQVTATKGERFRRLPLTSRLVAALKRMRHLRGARVLCESDGRPLTQKVVQGLVKSAAKRAGLSKGGLHILRHTFCSHLAMRGVPVTVIQRLAGHRELSTTIGYMHLNPRALAEAINLLDHRRVAEHFGDILETAGKSS
jgi:integrase